MTSASSSDLCLGHVFVYGAATVAILLSLLLPLRPDTTTRSVQLPEVNQDTLLATAPLFCSHCSAGCCSYADGNVAMRTTLLPLAHTCGTAASAADNTLLPLLFARSLDTPGLFSCQRSIRTP
jgi:hypothetical protein